MQDNIPNNWRSSLENTDDFPGESFNKSEAWEKLYARLHKKPRHKFVIRYWMAAACLLFVTIAILILMNKEKQQPDLVIKNSSPVKNGLPDAAKKSILAEENKGKTVTTFEQREKSIPALQPGKNVSFEKRTIVTNRPDLDSTNNSSFTKNLVTSLPHFDSSVIATVTAAPAKKKLRVVHINEIGQPEEESTVNRFAGRRAFEFRIINNEVYDPSANPVNNGLILFKSRNTSN